MLVRYDEITEAHVIIKKIQSERGQNETIYTSLNKREQREL